MNTNFKSDYDCSGCITDPSLTRAFWDHNPEAKDKLVDYLNWPAFGTLTSIPDNTIFEKVASLDHEGNPLSSYAIYPGAFDSNEGIVKFLVRPDEQDVYIYQVFWPTYNLMPSDFVKLSVQVENFSILYGDYADYGGKEIMPNINDVPLSWLPDVPTVQEILKSYDIPAPGLHKEPMASGENWILMSPVILTNEDRACLDALGMFEANNNNDVSQRSWQVAKDTSDAVLTKFIKIPD